MKARKRSDDEVIRTRHVADLYVAIAKLTLEQGVAMPSHETFKTGVMDRVLTLKGMGTMMAGRKLALTWELTPADGGTLTIRAREER